MLQTNVAAPALLAALFLPLLEKGTKKTIVNVSSGMGSLTQDHGSMMSMYCVSKAALNMLVRLSFRFLYETASHLVDSRRISK